MGVGAGPRLLLRRLILVGFDYAAPGSLAPVLWPAGLLQSSGSALNLTDVRLVTSSPDVFRSWLQFFGDVSSGPYWTVRVQLVQHAACCRCCFCACLSLPSGLCWDTAVNSASNAEISDCAYTGPAATAAAILVRRL